MKRIIVFLILVIMAFGSSTAMSEGKNAVRNGSFEEVAQDTASFWTENAWDKNGASEFRLDGNQQHSGTNSICITNNSTNDARLQQEIEVEKNTLYKLSCWIKTENVGEGSKGANLSVVGLVDSSEDIRGTSGQWKYVELFGETGGEQDSLIVSVGLGGYGNTNTGKAWFDDVSVEKVEELPEGAQAISLYYDGGQAVPDNPVQSSSSDNSYNGSLLAYAVGYMLLAIIAYHIFRKGSIRMPDRHGKMLLCAFLALGLVMRLVAGTKVEGFPVDIGCFKAWATAAANDLTNFYNTGMFCDYPPFYIYILFIIGKLSTIPWLGMDYTLLVKLPSILADLATAYIIYRLARKEFDMGIGVVLAGAYVFNPVVLLDSTLWGQVDSFFTLLIAAALLLLADRRIKLSSAVFAAAFLMKPQAIFFLPVLLYELIKRKSLKDFFQAFICALATAVIIIVPFSRDPLWIVRLFSGTASGYTYASMNAFNLFSLLGANLQDDSTGFLFLNYKLWGLIFDVLLVCLAGFLYLKGKHRALPFVMALLLNAGVFVLSTRMHERYMFPVLALALLAFVYLKDKRLIYVFATLAVTNFININSVLYRMLTFDNPHVPAEDMLMRITSLFNVLVLAYLVKILADILLRNKTKPYLEAASLKKQAIMKASKAKKR